MTDDLSARAAAILAALRELERVCEEATPGPWQSVRIPGFYAVEPGICDLKARPCMLSTTQPCRCLDDSLFIASSRTALPVLVRIGIAEVERAQELIALGAKARKHDGGPALTSLYFETDAEFILDLWSAILPQPKEGEHACMHDMLTAGYCDACGASIVGGDEKTLGHAPGRE